MKTQYRNVFAEIGIEQAQIKARLEEIRDFYFYGKEDERVYYPVGDDMAYIMDTGNNDARTEGMSYGMMICVQLDMREEFDRLWKWVKTYMWMEDGFHEGILRGPARRTARKMRTARHRTARSSSRWRSSSHRTDGGTGKVFSTIPTRRERSCGRACTKARTAEPACRCGTGTIIRYCSCRGSISRIRHIICLIFMSCLRCGRMRRTGHSGSVQRLRVAGIWRKHVMRRQDFLRSTPSLTEARFAGSSPGRRIGTTGSTATRTAPWQISGWTMSGLGRMRDSAMRRRRSRSFCSRLAEKIHTTSMR